MVSTQPSKFADGGEPDEGEVGSAGDEEELVAEEEVVADEEEDEDDEDEEDEEDEDEEVVLVDARASGSFCLANTLVIRLLTPPLPSFNCSITFVFLSLLFFS